MNLANYENMDPILLFSLVNTKLRDDFDGDLDKLVSVHDIDKEKLIKKLSAAGFDFLPEAGQFR
ncbi:DUF4250 domain-containing protein [Vibrio sp.]|uniref:DUF4250 domain-containing protein n=1 Tax=Vibrio viridaestus TaxID=2487322 RepID=A0A3N9TG10_9VIBR|nr:DUF4250 domain-containing protein [Vibrio viridaestus]MDC0610447.1 DUF4250 domain-containing protein [Vibrio sp.]RQW62415.1 DUF4250 domain-containing protein [Vibrio viridaestus]